MCCVCVCLYECVNESQKKHYFSVCLTVMQGFYTTRYGESIIIGRKLNNLKNAETTLQKHQQLHFAWPSKTFSNNNMNN